MNYQCIYEPDLLDYSHGKNGPPYDQNDWEKIFVGHFQNNDIVVEDPELTLPIDPNRLILGENEIGFTGYMYEENLTKNFVKSMNGWSPVDPIEANWTVFILEDDQINENYREVIVLVQPKSVPFAKWSKYAEGQLDSEGNIQFYSQKDLIDEAIGTYS